MKWIKGFLPPSPESGKKFRAMILGLVVLVLNAVYMSGNGEDKSQVFLAWLFADLGFVFWLIFLDYVF